MNFGIYILHTTVYFYFNSIPTENVGQLFTRCLFGLKEQLRCDEGRAGDLSSMGVYRASNWNMIPGGLFVGNANEAYINLGGTKVIPCSVRGWMDH